MRARGEGAEPPRPREAPLAPGRADGRALLRNLVVREGRRTGQLQVRLVTTDGELDAGEPGGGRLAGELGERLTGCSGRARAQPRPRRPPAARPSSCGARRSCPSGSASSTCGSRPRRSSRPTPRWPSCSTAIAARVRGARGLGARLRPLLRDRHDRAHARAARGRAVGARAGRAGGRRRDRGRRRNEITNAHFFAGDVRLALPSWSSAPGARTSWSSTRRAPASRKKVVHRIIEAARRGGSSTSPATRRRSRRTPPNWSRRAGADARARPSTCSRRRPTSSASRCSSG